jgi:hypothetical protein
MSKPRPLSQRELNLIELYGYCSFGMSPQAFKSKWSLSNDQIAFICDRSVPTVSLWFSTGRYYRRPTPNDLRHLGMMDFLLEHFEEIPPKIRNLVCSPTPDK